MKQTLLAVLALLALPALATKYAPPQARKIPSESGGVYIELSPKSEVHKVISKDGEKTLWSFKQSVWHEEYFVSDDGKRVVIVGWKHCKAEDAKETAIRVINQGKTEREYSYDQVSTPRKRGDRETGPIGDFWRIWKEKASTVKDQKLSITVAGGKPIIIDLKTGKKD